MMRTFLGVPYPTVRNPLGYWYSQSGIDQIKSDMLCLLLTNPGERVMLPEFGTPLRKLLFEMNDAVLVDEARNMIINSLKRWEPRIAVQNIEVSSNIDKTSLDNNDDQTELENILFIRIIFVDPQNIKEVQQLSLQVPLSQ
jgi:phage baseplate assembly protein W